MFVCVLVYSDTVLNSLHQLYITRPHLGAGVDVEQLRHRELGDGLRALGLGPAAVLSAEAGLGEGLEVELVIALGLGRPPAHAAAERLSVRLSFEEDLLSLDYYFCSSDFVLFSTCV